MLKEKYLSRPCFKGKILLGVLAFLAAKGRIREDHIECGRSSIKESAIGGSAGQRVAVPEIGLVNAVEHKVGKGDGYDEILLFPSEKGIVFQIGPDPCLPGIPNLRARCS